ncbi:MAG: succinate dehydrogenase assembly factor 4 [Acetobacterales bacterium]
MADNEPSETTPAGGADKAKTDNGQAVHPLTGKPMPKEVDGPKGPEPTRYGDWENKGRCSDF